jgi:hypothetical protein
MMGQGRARRGRPPGSPRGPFGQPGAVGAAQGVGAEGVAGRRRDHGAKQRTDPGPVSESCTRSALAWRSPTRRPVPADVSERSALPRGRSVTSPRGESQRRWTVVLPTPALAVIWSSSGWGTGVHQGFLGGVEDGPAHLRGAAVGAHGAWLSRPALARTGLLIHQRLRLCYRLGGALDVPTSAPSVSREPRQQEGRWSSCGKRAFHWSGSTSSGWVAQRRS